MKDFDKEMAELIAKKEPLLGQHDKINTKIMKLGKAIEKLREEKENEQMNSPMAPTEEIEYFLFEDGCVSGERYKSREKFWNDKGLWHSGYFHETSQINLEVMLYKGAHDNLERTLCALEQALPYIKDHKGVKRLGVFEHTLSECGSYGIEVTETSLDLIVHRYGRKSTEKSFDNLRSLLQYIQEHHYYESSEDGDDEE